MPLTLADAALLSQDMLVRGVVETVIEESAVLRYLPFIQIVGNSLRYNQELTLGSVDFYGVGDTWAEDAMTVAEKTAQLVILGGDADVDAFLQQTYSDPNDLRALVVAAKAKSLAHTFSDTFFNGNATANPLQFDGLKVLFSPYLPHSSARLHALLGYQDDLAVQGWRARSPAPGQALPAPKPLFVKLDPAAA